MMNAKTLRRGDKTKAPATRRETSVLVALFIAISVVIARSTMMESLRDPFGATMDSTLAPRNAGPASGLVLDLLACVPALLILTRRALDPNPAARNSWANRIAGLLAIWTIASVFWADDKFAAAVSAAHFTAAICLLWAVSQIVTTWQRFRLVAAVFHGLLLVNLAQACVYRFVDLPNFQKNFEQQKAEFFKERGWKPDDFLARQFAQKIENKEILGFTGSSNSYAAVLVLLMGVSFGLIIQRIVDHDHWAWSAFLAAAIPATICVLVWTLCKAAFFTPLLILLILLVVWKFPKFNYAGGFSLILLAAISIVAFGLTFHRLPGASLNFRWRYWTAAWQMFLDHPILGVGWSNFGLHYTHYRLPIAAEEIQDPHNLFLRFLTELGIPGAILAVAWLARLWWELTRNFSAALARGRDPIGIGFILLLAIAGITINFLCSVDLSQSVSFIVVELMPRALFALVLVLGATVAAIKSLNESTLDDRPAPWVLYASLASLGAFLIHNWIEFSFFETGPLLLATLMAGSALGLRQPPTATRRVTAVACVVAFALFLLTAALGFVVPVINSELLAQRGDDELHSRQFALASQDYFDAFQSTFKFNADYAYRAGFALAYQPDRTRVRNMLDEAIAADPSMVSYSISRAHLDADLGDEAGMSRDFSKALELNPDEVSIHLDFAAALMRFHQTAEAAAQCDLARKYNDLLPVEEPKRLSDEEIGERIDAILSARP
jgi:O-antigen ligase/tetratricopeptide (TPR) repeat protein